MPTILAIDLGSGGVSSARIQADLTVLDIHEMTWHRVHRPVKPALSASQIIECTLASVAGCLKGGPPPDAIVLASMMHTLLLTDTEGNASSPVFTWNDRIGRENQAKTRHRLGLDYHLRTGAHPHPAFPAFKLASLDQEKKDWRTGCRIASARSYLQAWLTGNWAEDVSTASASGMLNVGSGEWDPETLEALELHPSALPRLIHPTDVAGSLTEKAGRRMGLKPGTPVIAGGADGAMASLGSTGDQSRDLAVTLGTTGAVRRFVEKPVLEPDRGTFCYRFRPDRFLFGCATSNGGNVLDWARASIGTSNDSEADSATPPPLFFPFLEQERSPFWDGDRQARWMGIDQRHRPHHLWRSVAEGVIFQLAIYCELVASEPDALGRAILSGNGFQTPGLAETLAALIQSEVAQPAAPGQATLLGAARCGFEALGIGTETRAAELRRSVRPVQPISDPEIKSRFNAFKNEYLK